MTIPDKDGTYPVVVLVHGSGPNDRNESLGPNAPFRDIAWELAKQGISVYRYDKRTMVYPQECAEDTAFTINEETVEDAAAAAKMVKTLPGIDSERVYVLGHSLGGQMIPRIAGQAEAAGYIMMAPLVRNMQEAMAQQIEFLLNLPNVTQEQKAALEEQKKGVEELNEQLSKLDSLDPSEQLTGGSHPAYWKDLLSYDPVKEAENIDAPVLLLQGEEDYQVTIEEDYQQWKEQFSDAANWTFHTYPGLTHLFMKGEKQNGSADYAAAQTVDAQVISDIVKFVLQ